MGHLPHIELKRHLEAYRAGRSLSVPEELLSIPPAPVFEPYPARECTAAPSAWKHLFQLPLRFGRAFMEESRNTQRMARTFFRHGRQKLQPSRCKPSVEEWQQAVAQFRALPRLLPFAVLLILPVPGITEGYVLLAILLENSLGRRIRLLPDPFREIFQPTRQLA
jgi:hypothetical protein